jgi:transcriptional regulator with XRE-family HTH domain
MLGELLRKARLDAGLTQEELALRARVDRSYLSEIERNVRRPTVDMLLKLCRAANTSATNIVRQLESESRKKAR